MCFKPSNLALLTIASVLAVPVPVHADDGQNLKPGDNIMFRVSNDSWQPEGFVNGITIPATYSRQAAITLDGQDSEHEWSTASEVPVPLTYGSVTDAYVKAVYTDQKVFIRVRWPDPTEDREHHPWVWDAGQDRYVVGSQVEDSVMLSFEAGCEWTPSLLSGYDYDFDAWLWLAARSDPVGQAWDMYGSIYDRSSPIYPHTAYQSRSSSNTWNVKFNDYVGELSHKSWDQLDRSYNLRAVMPTVFYRVELDSTRRTDASRQVPPPQFPPEKESAVFPQFEAIKLENDAGEVSAKGHWEDGYWTVEFSRILETPSEYVTDSIFNRLTQFSIHVFDHAERIDQSSESGRLFLRFLPKEQLLVKD